MSSSEDFKIQVESFLQRFTTHINDKEILQQFETEYNNIMDQYSKLAIMSHEDLEGIENEITNLSNENSKLFSVNENLTKHNENQNKIIKNLEHKSKIEFDKIEGLNEKIKILQNTLETYSNKSNESELEINNLRQGISETKNEYSNLKIKYNTLQDEMEIYNKNVKKNFSLEVAIKELTEENEKLHKMVTNLQSSEDCKIKFLLAQSELKELNEKYNFISTSYKELKNDHEKLSNENFEKFDVINNLHNELKIKNYKIEELEKEKKSMMKDSEELQNKLKESDYSVRSKKVFFENQMKEFKKEIDKLIKSNETSKKENSELTEQLKKVQHYTNFAKASKENLCKKDFSILENMSRRIEELTNLNEHMKSHVQSLGMENDVLKNKVVSLENITFHYIKDDYNLLLKQTENQIIPEEELSEIKLVKNDAEKLMQIVLKIKEDNFNLKKEMAEITIEFNKTLRLNSENCETNKNSKNYKEK